MSLKEVIKSLTNQKPRKLFSHLYRLQDYGVGRQFTRVIWKFDDVTPNYKGSTRWGDPRSYWTITRVKPDGVLRSGRVWGKLTWRGKEDPKEKRIKTCRKLHWKLIPQQPSDQEKSNEQNLSSSL